MRSKHSLAVGRSSGSCAVQSLISSKMSAGQSSGHLGSASRPRVTGMMPVTICTGVQSAIEVSIPFLLSISDGVGLRFVALHWAKTSNMSAGRRFVLWMTACAS